MNLTKRELLLMGLVAILLAVNVGLILKIESQSGTVITQGNLDSIFVEEDEYEEAEIVVHVTGQVDKRGVVYMKEGARIVDAIDAAGGALETADLDRINLAKVLQDGEKVHVPGRGEIMANYTDLGYNGEENALVNINTANAAELETLQGIGQVLAKRIIDFRAKEGRFGKPEDLMKVSGIGIKVFEGLKDSIRVR